MEPEVQRYELTYCDQIEQIDGNILKVPSNLLSILDNEDIVVEGESEDQCIFNAGGNSFKMRGIFLPTTMLVTPALGITLASDQSNSEQKPFRPITKVLIGTNTLREETSKYLKIEPHLIEFNRIFKEIQNLALGSNILTEQLDINKIIDNEGITVAQLKTRYRITQSHVEKIAEAAPMTFFKSEENSEVIAIQLSYAFMIGVLRQLISSLTSDSRLSLPFLFSELPKSVPIIDIKFLEVIARHFSFQVNPPLSPPSISCNEMQIQRTFKITLDTIIKHIVVELVLTSKQFIQDEMENLIKGMLVTYLPVGDAQFTEEKAEERVQDIVSEYFITVSKEAKMKKVYYNPLFFDFNVKARVQQISSFKKRFTKAQLYGIFSCWYSVKEIEDILMKNFRKMGKEYEIKLSIPK